MEYVGRVFLILFLIRWAYGKFAQANPELARDVKQRAGEKARGWLTRVLKQPEDRHAE